MPFARGVAGSAARRSPTAALCISALFAVLAVAFLVGAPAASAKKALPGGVSARAGLEAEIPESTEAPTEVESGVPGAGEGEFETGAAGKAALLGTRAVAPLNAPAAVKRVIAAANHIRTLPYVWGGGHGSWASSGYDCSGAVSYALHGGGLLTTPLVSGSMETFGEAGPGKWITIYANASHAYMVVAGLRFDTAGDTSGTGPRWHPTTAAAASGTFVVRHPVGY
jgi:cell wall-associated NlpC family hydrolase